jgi:hypothetical protein
MQQRTNGNAREFQPPNKELDSPSKSDMISSMLPTLQEHCRSVAVRDVSCIFICVVSFR